MDDPEAALKPGRICYAKDGLTHPLPADTPKPGVPLSQFFTILLDIRNQLSGTEQAIDDTMIKARIFATAPLEFETTSIYQQNLPEDTPLETIMDAFKRDESIRALRTDPPALKEALYNNTSNF